MRAVWIKTGLFIVFLWIACFQREPNAHLSALPSHSFRLSLALSGSKEQLRGAHQDAGHVSDHHCMRCTWWHKARVMWYCHQSALTGTVQTDPRQARSYCIQGRSRTGQGRGTHTRTNNVSYMMEAWWSLHGGDLMGWACKHLREGQRRSHTGELLLYRSELDHNFTSWSRRYPPPRTRCRSGCQDTPPLGRWRVHSGICWRWRFPGETRCTGALRGAEASFGVYCAVFGSKQT